MSKEKTMESVGSIGEGISSFGVDSGSGASEKVNSILEDGAEKVSDVASWGDY
jgi:hypothetical protein